MLEIFLKDKKGIRVTSAFQKILKESNSKPNKIWVDKESEFYNISVKKRLKCNDIEICSKHNQGKLVVAERFIRNLKTKIYKYMTSISKNVYIDKLTGIVNGYNNTYHRTVKMKPVDVKDNKYIDSMEWHSSKEVNDKVPKFKVGDHVKSSKQTGLKKFFVIKNVKNTVPWTYVINDLMVKKLLKHVMKKNYERLINKNLG